MAAMLFCMSALAVFFIAAWLADKCVPDKAWDKLMHMMRFD